MEQYWNEGIPEGPYCYTYLGPADHGGYKIKSCPHFRGIDSLEGWCHLLDMEVVDQVKGCGINELDVCC